MAMTNPSAIQHILEGRGETSRDLLLTSPRHWPMLWWEGRGLESEQMADELERLAAPSVAPADTHIVFLHGKESGPLGGKYRLLADTFGLGRVGSPSFVGLDLEARLARAEEYTRPLEDALLVGSSMGGLVAAMLYSRYPSRFASYVLCAAAVNWAPPGEIVRAPADGKLIHGSRDEIIPVESSREFCREWGLDLLVTDDGHRLLGSLPEILAAVRELCDLRAPES